MCADVDPQVADQIAAFGTDSADPAQVLYDLPLRPQHVGRRTIALEGLVGEDEWTKQAWNAGIDIRARLGLPAPGGPIPESFNVVEALWLLHEELEAEGASHADIAALESTITLVSESESTSRNTSGQDVVNLLLRSFAGSFERGMQRSMSVSGIPSQPATPGDKWRTSDDRTPDDATITYPSSESPYGLSLDPTDPNAERWLPERYPNLEPDLPPLPGTQGSRLVGGFLAALTRGELVLPRRKWSGSFHLVKIREVLPPQAEEPEFIEAPFTHAVGPPRPALFLLESYSISLTPTGFGLGRPVRVATFLPGESQSIPWLYWRPTDSVVATTIIDSFTPFAADAFCNEVFVRLADEPIRQLTDTYGFEMSRKSGFNPNVEATDGATVLAFQLGRLEFAGRLRGALHEHVARATDYRTAFEDADRPMRDPAPFHRSSNVNLGRTMSVVYRQLNQRYHCEIRLTDIQIGFSNGRLRSWREAPLWKLKDFVSALVVGSAVAGVEQAIFKAAATVLDKEGSEKIILDEVANGDGVFGATPALGDAVYRIKPAIGDAGVLLDEFELTVPSGSVLGEVLMGLADSLDRYALGLQAADIASRSNDNALQKVEIDALEAINVAEDRAEAYAKAFRPDDTFKVDLRPSP